MIFLLLTITRMEVKIMLIANASGYKTAYDQGYSQGSMDAYTEGYEHAKSDIRDYIEQIKSGVLEDEPIADSLESLLKEIYDLGYFSGENDGFYQGYSEGYDKGWQDGDAGLEPDPGNPYSETA